jgi:endonuclease/exonuclease/phosphatase (EEP) superfamily protein YafD
MIRAVKIWLTSLSIFIYPFNSFTKTTSHPIPEDHETIRTLGMASVSYLNPDNIKILVWNIYKGQKENFKKDFLRLAQNKHVLVIQEAYATEDVEETITNNDKHFFQMAISFFAPPLKIATGVATGAVADACEVHFQRSRYREPIIKTPKMVLFTKYRLYGMEKELLVANIHGINFVPTIALSNQLRRAVKVIQKHSGPVIFAGDFNTWSRAKSNLLNRTINKLKMKPIKFRPDNRMMVFDFPLDHVLVRGMEVIESKVWGSIDGSDHKPMTAQLKVKL